MLDLIRPYLAAIKLAGASVLAMFLFAGGCKVGAGNLAAEQAAHRATKAAHAAVLEDLAAKTAHAARLAEEAGKAAAIERVANDKRFDDAKRQADKAGRDLAAALRAGTQRLQPWWGAHCPGAVEGDTAAAADGQNGYAELRATSAGRIAAIADEADATVIWLQSEIMSTRKACGVE